MKRVSVTRVQLTNMLRRLGYEVELQPARNPPSGAGRGGEPTVQGARDVW